MKGEILGFGAALVLFTSAAIWLNRKQIREWWNREPVRLGPDHETHRPADASTGSAGRCSNCRTHPAFVWVIPTDDLGGGVRKVCHGCHDEGVGKSWWRMSLGENVNVYDLAVAREIADIDDIEAYANGGSL